MRWAGRGRGGSFLGGPVIFLAASLTAGATNLVALRDVDSDVVGRVGLDLSAVLAALTVLSFAVLCLQFVFARGVQPGGRIRTVEAVVPALAMAFVVALIACVIIDADSSFRLGLAGVLSLVVVTAVLPSPATAGLLRNRRWMWLSLIVLVTPASRLILWQVQPLRTSLLRLLLGLALSQVVGWLVVLIATHRALPDPGSRLIWKQQRIPVAILTGLIGLIGLSSYARQAKLGAGSERLTDATLAGRNIFFLVAIVAYLSIPDLVDHRLFSRELARYFRIAASIAGVIAVSLLAVALVAPGVLSVSSSNAATSDGLIRLASVGWAAMSIALIPLFYYVAHNSRFGLIVFAPLLLMLIVQMITTSPTMFAAAFALVAVTLAVGLTVPAIARNRSCVQPAMAHKVDGVHLELGGVTIVVPSFNSGEHGIKTVREIRQAFTASGIDVAVIAVSDGSTDNSVHFFDELKEPWFRHLRLVRNEGKGAALLVGFENSETTYTGFIDADGDIPPRLLPGMVSLLESTEADIVFGSKWHPQSTLMVSRRRRLISRIHHLLQVMLFKIDIDDTQAGIKIFRSDLLQEIAPTLRERKFSLDLEIFVSAHAHGYSKFVEVPIEIRRTGASSISIYDVLASFADMVRIAWRSRISLDYASRAYQSLASRNGVDK